MSDVNPFTKGHELGWTVKQISAKPPYEYWVEPTGSMNIGGPEPDKHFARGRKDLEALIRAIEAGEPTDRWRTPH